MYLLIIISHSTIPVILHLYELCFIFDFIIIFYLLINIIYTYEYSRLITKKDNQEKYIVIDFNNKLSIYVIFIHSFIWF